MAVWRNDVEMVNNALQNLAEGGLRRRQMEQQQAMEMQRIALEQQLRDQQEKRLDVDLAFRNAQQAHYGQLEDAANRRADAQEAKADLANQPKVMATVTHPSGVSMDFIGTPDQLAAMQAKEPGLKVTGKKDFYAKFDIGGSSFMFNDPDSADKFAADMKAKHGIDVYANQAPTVTNLPTGQPVVTDKRGGVKLGEMPPKPNGFTETTVKQEPNPLGGTLSLTNTTTRIPSGYPAPPPASNKPPVINSQEDYDALPIGAAYTDSNGTTTTKKAKPIPGGGGLPIELPGQ